MSEFVKRLQVVSSELAPPPYDSNTMANGYGFDLDVVRIQNSDSWVLCPPDVRPWMMMSWVISWVQHPCGSLPSDDELIAARLGCSLEFLKVHRRFILRGWVRHSDDRLYHKVVTEEVVKMIECREKWKNKKKWQRSNKQEVSENVPGDTEETLKGVPVVSRPYPSPYPSPSINKLGKPNLSEVADATPDLAAPDSVESSSVHSCPHQDIICLYLETLPELPRVVLSRWPRSQGERDLKTRWREDPRHRSLDFWKRFFSAVRSNPHWMGENQRGWQADLRWLLKRENFDKVICRLVAEVANG